AGRTNAQAMLADPIELRSNVGDGACGSGGGFGLKISVLDLKPVGELGTEHELRQLVVPVESSPAFLRGLDELEDHGQRRRSRETALSADGPVAHGGKRALDGVRGAQVLPMLGREVVEGEQRLAILVQACRRLLELQRITGRERIEGFRGIL